MAISPVLPVETPAPDPADLITTEETSPVEGPKDALDEGTTEAPKEETPKEEAPKAEPLSAEALTALIPEGFTLDEKTSNEFLAIINTEMPAGERAKALLTMYSTAMKSAAEAPINAWDDMLKEWKVKTREDPIVGGEKYDTSVATINDLIRRYGTKELRDNIRLTGLGNNQHFWQFLVKISDMIPKEAVPPKSDAPSAKEAQADFAKRFVS